MKILIEVLRNEVLGDYPHEGLEEAFRELLNIANGQEVDEEEIEEAIDSGTGELADSMVNHYTSELLDWYKTDLDRVYLMEEAISELGAKDGFQVLSGGQYLYWQEKLSEVQAKLKDWFEERK